MNGEIDLPHCLLVVWNTYSAFKTSVHAEVGACHVLIIDQAEAVTWKTLPHHIRTGFNRIPHEYDSRRHSRHLKFRFCWCQFRLYILLVAGFPTHLYLSVHLPGH